MSEHNGIPVKWIAKAVEGHSNAGLTECLYTSDAAPVEAEYVAKLEAEIVELRSKLAADPVDAVRAIYDSVPVSNWTRKPLRAIREWLAARGKPVSA